MGQRVIAVIDDDDFVRDSTSILLRSFGYSTRQFSSAEEFLDSVGADVDCIVTDLQMPGLSGLDLSERLRKQGSLVPVILVTAFATAQISERAHALDVVALLGKPLASRELAGALGRALS